MFATPAGSVVLQSAVMEKVWLHQQRKKSLGQLSFILFAHILRGCCFVVSRTLCVPGGSFVTVTDQGCKIYSCSDMCCVQHA